MNIILVCDRSGGHIFPAANLVTHLEKNGYTPYIFTSSSYFQDYLGGKGYRVIGRQYKFKNIFLEYFYRLFEALFFIARFRPAKILGFGGRESFYFIIFGSLFFIKTGIYEPNVIPGKANRILAFFAGNVYRGFNERKISGRRGKKAGIPIRDNFKRIDKAEAKRYLGFSPDKKVILSFGGSQGAAFINTLTCDFAANSSKDFCVIHLTGEKKYGQISEFYSKIDTKSFVRGFFDDIDILYSAADVVISRAGAGTLAEISFFRVPAILIPYPYASNHQYANAEYFRKRGAAVVFCQNNLSFSRFKNTLEDVIENEVVRDSLIKNLGMISIAVESGEFYKNIFI